MGPAIMRQRKPWACHASYAASVSEARAKIAKISRGRNGTMPRPLRATPEECSPAKPCAGSLRQGAVRCCRAAPTRLGSCSPLTKGASSMCLHAHLGAAARLWGPRPLSGSRAGWTARPGRSGRRCMWAGQSSAGAGAPGPRVASRLQAADHVGGWAGNTLHECFCRMPSQSARKSGTQAPYAFLLACVPRGRPSQGPGWRMVLRLRGALLLRPTTGTLSARARAIRQGIEACERSSCTGAVHACFVQCFVCPTMQCVWGACTPSCSRGLQQSAPVLPLMRTLSVVTTPHMAQSTS